MLSLPKIGPDRTMVRLIEVDLSKFRGVKINNDPKNTRNDSMANAILRFSGLLCGTSNSCDWKNVRVIEVEIKIMVSKNNDPELRPIEEQQL